MQNRFYYHIIHLYLALVEISESMWPNCQAAQYQMWVSDATNLVKDQETIELVMKKIWFIQFKPKPVIRFCYSDVKDQCSFITYGINAHFMIQ